MTEFGKLGKAEYVHNEKTLMLAKFFMPDLYVPQNYDFDRGRASFPVHMWGNDAFGDCVIAGEANHLLRLERIEQRHTISMLDRDAVARYKALTGCQEPGDDNDTGLEIIAAMRNWRNVGWQLTPTRNYKIYAYGELEPGDEKQLRTAAYVLHGIHLGFWLPVAAQHMTSLGVWDYQGESGSSWQPGSWGGHLVYAKAFDADTFEILTWGRKIRVTNSFIDKYCDEAWAVVDSPDAWRTKSVLDISKLTEALSQITSQVNQ